MSEKVVVTFPALELRIPDESQRLLEAITIPWNETSFLTPNPAGERFVPGSLTRTIAERGDRIKLFRCHNHDRAVGTAVAWDTEHKAGLWGQFRVAKTPAGDEVLNEVAEGMLDAFSIGFEMLRDRRGSDGAREVLECRLREVSIAPIAAYDGARLLAVRTPQVNVPLPPMPAVNLDPIPTLSHWAY